MITIIRFLSKNGIEVSSELGLAKFNLIIFQLIALTLMVINSGFLEQSVSYLMLKVAVVLALILSMIVTYYSGTNRLK